MIEMDLVYYYKKLGKCYNCTDGGEGSAGCGIKAVCQYDHITGILLKTWDSIGAAQEQLNINNIGACCRRKRNLAGDWI